MQEQFSDLDTGWSWIVMLASFASAFVIGGTSYTVGMIHTTLLEMYNEGQATTSLVGALHNAITYLAAPICSIVIDRFSSRTALITSGAFYTIGFFATAFSSSIGVTILTCGVISGFGGAFGLTASMVTTGFYFRRYRNLAQGFAISGTGVGMFGMAPAMQTAREVYGNSGFFIILACASIHLIVFGMATIPSKLEVHTHKLRLEVNRKKEDKNKCSRLLVDYFKVFSTKSITCLSLSYLMFTAGIFVILLYLPNYCIQQGVSHMQASFILSVCGAAGIFGRLLTGLIANCDNVNEALLFSGSMGIIGVATCLFPFFSNVYAGQIVYAIIFGLFFGSPFVTTTPINICYVGVSNMAAALGIELCLGGFGAIVGPVLGGILLDNGGAYEHAFIMAGISLFIASAFGVASLVFAKCAVSTEDKSKSGVKLEMAINYEEESQKMLGASNTNEKVAEIT